jgi:O-6-methylguanine DNA methyltransferase
MFEALPASGASSVDTLHSSFSINVILLRTTLATPLGPMLALASEAGLCGLEFDRPERATRLYARLHRWLPEHEFQEGEHEYHAATRRWLDVYFADPAATSRTPPISGTPMTSGTHVLRGESPALHLLGTSFELDVWQALMLIPPGQTTTYGAIARDLDRQDASRAVGAAVGANPVSLIVPCHRVVGASGSLTGYGGGLDRKQWLLRHEGAKGWVGDLLI